ncbi:MAG: DUF1697 domain-containing protein [Candidatus Taylorbacteria bacterium]|nr:DUF1697 domain-containing protein [Candidatus Taylorbacteria bacterium]
MIKYVAFLRGVNIGGNNKVEMVRLKKSFESLEFSNVSTYLNSGNVIFSDTSKNVKNITDKIEKEILKEFKLEIRVMVRDIKNIEKILDNIPVSWISELGMRPHVAFLWADIDYPDILKLVGVNLKVDQVKYVPGAILWNVELKYWSKDTVYKFTNGKLSKQITVRSINTVRKLNELMK